MTMDFNNAGGGRRGDQVRDLMSVSEFENLLSDAEAEALPGKQEDFVSDMRDKFDEYAGQMYLSHAQLNWLRSIAGWD